MCARSATSFTSLGRSKVAWIATAAAAVALSVLARNLPTHGFYSGDSGVKLIAAFNAIAHPAHPLDVELPRIAGASTRYVERFFEVHDDHAHALQSPLFPLLAAPLVALFGVGGAYILPAASFIALTPLLFRIQRTTAPEVRPWLMAIVAVAANPVLFYGLEVWEHAPAIALLAAATAFAPERPAAAGVLGGLAMLLRPEALWYAAGLVALTSRGRWKAYLLGLVVAVAPFAIYNVAHSGNALGPHAGANLAPLAGDWAAARAQRVALWLLPSAPAAAIGFVLVAAAHVARLAGFSLAKSQVLALGGAVVVGLSAIGGALPRESLWRVWPLAMLLLVPGLTVRNRLWAPIVVTIAGVVLSSTHDGGAQWGPRFLLIAAPAMIVMACQAAQRAIERKGGWFAARAALVALLLVSAAYATRDAYRELRGTKQFYARIADEAVRAIPAGSYVISRVWWFDQITAAAYGRQTILYADDEQEERAALGELQSAGVNAATLILSQETGERQSAPATTGTCFQLAGERRIEQRSLRFLSLSCAR